MDSSQSEPVSAFVLAGGQSSRMGQDKALLRLPTGDTLLTHALALASSVTAVVTLVAPAQRYARFTSNVPVLEDVYPERGPLGGIHAALSASGTDLNLILGVDCPRLTPELLRFLVRIAASEPALATVPRVARYLHNVCAVYRRGFRLAAERTLAASAPLPRPRERVIGAGQRTPPIERLLATVPCRIVEELELRAAGFGPELFVNVNTPEDFSALSSALNTQP